MKYSESLKKNRDFQNVYKKGKILCKSLSGDVRSEKRYRKKPVRHIGK